MGTFLIADDSPGKMAFLRKHVEKAGWKTILTAETTEEAKALIDAHKIDAAFIDYFIPSENGAAVIAYLREKHPSAHLALATSSESESVADKAMKAGAERVICTSIDERDLIDAVDDLLQEWGAAAR